MNPGAPASVTAVIAAAGSGERLGAGGPKAFVHLAGRPMVEWSIEAFRAAGVAAVVVAVPPGHSYEPAVVEPHGADTPEAPLEVRVLAGGETRSASVSNALEAVETELVAIHDAARPLLTAELVRGVVGTLSADPEAAGAIAAAPLTDTVKRADGAGNAALVVEETVDRAELWAAQTPQAFRVEALREALAGDDERAAATDEAMLVEAAGGRVLIHPVEAENIKVTTALDFRVAEQLLAGRG
jgi:2-C-methyl-D-erythritol 4-phosphate cytidylyltransferase